MARAVHDADKPTHQYGIVYTLNGRELTDWFATQADVDERLPQYAAEEAKKK